MNAHILQVPDPQAPPAGFCESFAGLFKATGYIEFLLREGGTGNCDHQLVAVIRGYTGFLNLLLSFKARAEYPSKL